MNRILIFGRIRGIFYNKCFVLYSILYYGLRIIRELLGLERGNFEKYFFLNRPLHLEGVRIYVAIEEGIDKAELYGLYFFKTSKVDETNINELFELFASEVNYKINNKELQLNSLPLTILHTSQNDNH